MAGHLFEKLEECKPFCKNFPDPLLVIDSGGMILDACDIVKESIGVPASKLIGKSLYKLPVFSKEEARVLRKLVKDAFAKRKVGQPDISVQTKDGERLMQVITSVLSENNEKLLFFILRDVTDLRKAERELKESEHRYHELFDNMRSGVAVYEAIRGGKDFVFKDFNKAAQRSDKIKRGDVLGKRVTKIFPGIEEIGFLKVLRRVWKTGKPEYFPPTIYQDDRIGKVWWEDYVYKLPSGEIVAAFANITERMKALNDLKKSMEEVIEERDKMNTIVQSIADAVFVVDRKYHIILFNEAAAQISGYRAEEALGKRYDNVLRFVYEKNEKKVDSFIKDVMETGRSKPLKDHIALINRDGDRIPIAHSASALKGDDGVRGIVVVFRDVTLERETDRTKTEFVSIVSNQLQMPLTSIKWFLELILREKAGPISEEQRKYLEQVYASHKRMTTLVEDLLSASRIGISDEFTINKKRSDVIRIIENAINDNIDLIREYKVTVVKQEGMPEQLTLDIDVEKIRQVLYNLISNAVKYSKSRGKVEVGCDCSKKDFITIFVKDYGYGIPKRQQHRVFERFFRADNVVTKVAEGTGLGLNIVKSIVEAHGGKIWFTTTENVGTTFFFTIPRSQRIKKRRRSKPTERSMLQKKK